MEAMVVGLGLLTTASEHLLEFKEPAVSLLFLGYLFLVLHSLHSANLRQLLLPNRLLIDRIALLIDASEIFELLQYLVSAVSRVLLGKDLDEVGLPVVLDPILKD